MEHQTDVSSEGHTMGESSNSWNSLKHSEVYPMDYGKIGMCYIFNHKKFESSLKLDERSGTIVDARQLNLLFSSLGFEVYNFDDYDDDQILLELQKVSKKESTKYCCFVCCILTYGTDDDDELFAFNEMYPIQRIYDHFLADKCTFMFGKPKMFFIQACPSGRKRSLYQSTDSESQVSFKIPTNADFLVVYSTVPGHYSWENSDDGSWFIDALCSTVSEYAKDMDLFQLLSIVNNKVSVKCDNAKLKVEVPCVTSTLTRDIKIPVKQSLESKLINRDADFTYNIGSCPKSGKVIIFNHEFYDNDPENENSREGTDVASENLEKIFRSLYFDVQVHKDKKKDFILEQLKAVGDGSHEEYSCFICCILTHGNYGTLCAKDGSYKKDDIFSLFYDKWSGKPKIFFIQACQGDNLNPGFAMGECRRLSNDLVGNFNFRHLTDPDFLIVSSTAPGYFSFRNETYGSWFVQELSRAFVNHANDKEFLQLLTITNRQVAIERRSYCRDKKKNNKKQTLCLTSTLTKNIDFSYLKQKN